MSSTFGSQSLSYVGHTVWKFRGTEHTYGLVERMYSLRYPREIDPIINAGDIGLFRRGTHHEVLEALNMVSAKIQVDDRTRVVSGTYRMLRGRVVEIGKGDTIHFQCENVPSAESVEVERIFDLGDFVEVM
jgi:hypothetical protein